MKMSREQVNTLNLLSEPKNFLHFMPYWGRFNRTAYYFDHNNMKRVRHSTVQALLKKDLVRKINKKEFGDHKIVLKKEESKHGK